MLCGLQHQSRNHFQAEVPDCKKKELHLNSTSNAFQRKYKNFDKNFSCVYLP